MASTKIRSGQINVNADFDINSQKLINVATPSSATDAANKSYVDSVASGLDVKQSAKAGTTANITLSGAQTIDGVSISAGMRVLVKDQTDPTENGIYDAASGAWARSSDFDTTAEVTPGAFVFIEEGTVNADTGWVVTSDGTITIGSSNIAFAQFSGGGTITAGAGLTKTGSTIDVVSGNGGIVVNANDITLTLDGSTLSVGASGIKLADLADGKILIGNGSNVATAQTLSGDATISNTGVVTLASNVLKEADIVVNETPSGTINGSNTSFTLAATPVAGTVQVFLNGILQESGAGNDYTISGTTITYLSAPLTGDKLRVHYVK